MSESVENKDNEILGYNPNRDSGIAAARSYIEIPKENIPSGLIQEYGFVPAPTQRYFAQLVYNVGGGGIGGSLTEADRETLAKVKNLMPYIEYLAAANFQVNELIIKYSEISELINPDVSINDIHTPIPVQVNENGEYEKVVLSDGIANAEKDEADLDLSNRLNGTNKFANTDILVNVSGYVSDMECYVWESNETGSIIDVSKNTVRFLAPTTYTGPTKENPFGITTIYLSSSMWESIGKLPAEGGKQIIKIHYLQLPRQVTFETDKN